MTKDYLFVAYHLHDCIFCTVNITAPSIYIFITVEIIECLNVYIIMVLNNFFYINLFCDQISDGGGKIVGWFI